MNAETKTFLKRYFAVAFGVWLLFAITLGPGDLSCAYRAEYREDHDRYLNISKSEAYKRYTQRPHLNEPGMEGVPESFTWAQIDFLEEYEGRDDFRRERRRSTFYTVFFQFFNAGLVVWIAWRLGKAPLLKLLDNQIHELRDKLAAIRNAREAAAARKNAAQEKLARIDDEDERISAETQARLARETDELEEKQQRRLEIMCREMEDRKKEEAHAALMAAKAELVDKAVNALLQTYKETDNETLQAKLIDAFTADLEKQVS